MPERGEESVNRKPVSYTHLDVYKRQDADFVVWSANPIETYEGRIEKVFMQGKVVYVPVSYTHLDVYKRQGLRRKRMKIR